MPGPPSHHQLPRWVDPRKFAQQGVTLAGQIPGDALPRLARAVADIPVPVSAELSFAIEGSGLRTVRGPLRARVAVVCQRCMGETEIELESELAVGLVASDQEAKQLPKQLEPWLVSREEPESDLYTAIEDELLLDLPMVVYHDYQCIDEELYSAGDDKTAAAPEEDRNNPFQVLEQLKSRKK